MWLSAPLSDPNAALWASITPPANRDIPTLVRRRAAAYSLDVLAQRLHLRFPGYFSSRSTARTGILGAAMAFGAAVGVIGFLALGAWQQSSSVSDEAREASAVEALQPASTRAPAAAPAAAASQLISRRATFDDAAEAAAVPASTATTTTTEATPPTFAASALPMASAERAIVTPTHRRAQLKERRAASRAKAKAKAKRLASARSKASARRATKARRTRAMVE